MSDWIEISIAEGKRTLGFNKGSKCVYIRYGKDSPYRNGRDLTETEQAMSVEIFELRKQLADLRRRVEIAEAKEYE